MDAIFNRTSVRKYKRKSLKKEEIDLILKAAFSAPSARNSQSWQFIVVENKDTLKDLSQMTPYASFLKDAAMGMVVCADKNKNDSLDYCQTSWTDSSTGACGSNTVTGASSKPRYRWPTTC